MSRGNCKSLRCQSCNSNRALLLQLKESITIALRDDEKQELSDDEFMGFSRGFVSILNKNKKVNSSKTSTNQELELQEIKINQMKLEKLKWEKIERERLEKERQDKLEKERQNKLLCDMIKRKRLKELDLWWKNNYPTAFWD